MAFLSATGNMAEYENQLFKHKSLNIKDNEPDQPIELRSNTAMVSNMAVVYNVATIATIRTQWPPPQTKAT